MTFDGALPEYYYETLFGVKSYTFKQISIGATLSTSSEAIQGTQTPPFRPETIAPDVESVPPAAFVCAR